MNHNNITKIAKFLAITLITIGLFAACTTSVTPSDDNTPPPATTEGSGETGESPGGYAPITTEDEAPDFDGYHFVLTTLWPGNIIGDDVHRTVVHEQRIQRIREVEERYNITIEIRPTTDETPEAFIIAYHAGEVFGCFVNNNAEVVMDLHFAGMLQNLRALDAFDPDHFISNTLITRVSTFDDFTFAIGPTEGGPPTAVFHNDSMRARLGLEPVQDLVMRGEWTWDVFLEYALAATDPAQGTYGVADNADGVMNMVMAGNDAMPVVRQDGRFVFNGQSPEVIRSLEFMSDLFNLHRVVAPGGGWNERPFEEFMAGQIMFMPMNLNTWFALLMNQGMSDDYIIVPAPLSPEVAALNDGFRAHVGRGWGAFYMPANHPNPEVAMTIMNALYYPLPGHGPEDEWMFRRLNYFRDDFSVDMLDMLNDVAVFNYFYANALPAQYNFVGMVNSIALGQDSPAAGMEMIRDLMQHLMDQRFRQ